MKHAIIAVLTATFALGMSSGVRADNLTYLQKQELSCSAIASAVTDAAIKKDVGMRDNMKIYEGARALCKQSYNQASAEYSYAKARASAENLAGAVGGVVVQLAYDSYKRDNEGAK